MDGSIVASALVKIVCEKVGSSLLNEFSLLWGNKKDLKALENTILTIKDVLEDAEECCITHKQIYNWLRKLKEIVYDADDILDKLYLESQRRKDESGAQTRVINNFLSKSNPLKQLKLAHNIRSINKKLDAIAAEREKFHLKSKAVRHREIDVNYQETWSMIDEGEICGRDCEKEEIISWLMQNDGQENISVISIVGLGGLGKTTLAQLAYNNENDLKGYFDFRIWIYVSQNFEVKRIVRAMIESVTQTKCEIDNLNSLGETLRNVLSRKKFLLVLDDVWNENQQEWEKLKCPLNAGASGSKVIVTTRSMRVSKIMKAISITLKELSEEMSWNLFKQRAFSGTEREFHSRILEIAKEIIRKCGGVPLALKALGSSMQFKDNIEEWTAVRDSDIWALGDDGNQVMRSLKLSYMHLPPSLKECFTFCSIFPKGEQINKLELINQWIAHGLIALPYNMDDVEDKGNEYYKHLIQMSFLQNIEYSNGQACMMHDLVHDLARSIVGYEFSDMKGPELMTNIGISYRYLSLVNYSKTINANIIKKVRALHIQSSYFDVADMVVKAKSLRSLVLERVKFDSLPICSKLIHLRYICITGCELLVIPYEIGSLWSLQALHLKGVREITNLPESIGKLVVLRTLELQCYKLKSLPESIGQCRSLQNLIVWSRKIESVPSTIDQLANIRSVNFSGCYRLKSLSNIAFEKLNFIKNISLSNCKALTELPISIGNLESLESLDLSHCSNLKFLPDSMGNLHNLLVLNLEESSLEKLPPSICKLVNLITLNLFAIHLYELPRQLGDMKKLRYLYIDDFFYEGMPIGIGKLIDLRMLSYFNVGSECRDYASISELKDLKFLSGNLTISGLQNVHNPIEAEHAALKQKQYLDSLELSWDVYAESRSHVNNSLAVLEALQPPSSIKSLTLSGYPGSEYPEWMMLAFPCLTSLTLTELEWCSSLPSLVKLPHIRSLHLWRIHNLTIIRGYFPSMVELYLSEMFNLEELTTMIFVNSDNWGAADVYKPAFPRLSKLKIRNCPKLRIEPHIPPSILELELDQAENLLIGYENETSPFPTCFGETSSRVSPSSLSIRQLTIKDMKLTTGPVLLGQLSTLTTLIVLDCVLSSLPESMRHASSLLVLDIGGCKQLHALPEWLGELEYLQELYLWDIPIFFLPQSMKNLTQLQYLSIEGCSELEQRCQRENGEDWHLISHIPHVALIELPTVSPR